MGALYTDIINALEGLFPPGARSSSCTSSTAGGSSKWERCGPHWEYLEQPSAKAPKFSTPRKPSSSKPRLG